MLDCQWCNNIQSVEDMFSVDACSEGCQRELTPELYVPKIGDLVNATMNGDVWHSGTYEENIDLFTPYGVRLDSGELRFFAHIQEMEITKSERADPN